MRKRIVLPVTAVATIVVGGLFGIAPAGSAVPGPVVVASGLNNPRQIVLVGGSRTELLVAEAGTGGSTVISSPEGDEYVGRTGSIASIVNPATASDVTPKRVTTGLLSAAGQDGSFAVGADGVAARYAGGKVYPLITYAPPDVLPNPVISAQSGQLLLSHRNGKITFPIENISAYELAHDPDGQGVDSNPYAAFARKDDMLVADAAGNDVLRISKQGYGKISVFHVFPNITDGPCASQQDPPPFAGCNFVPTSLAEDAAGHVFVGALAGETPGEGRVVELDASGKHVIKTWTGFTSVDGVAVGPDGSLYVSQLEATEAHPANPMFVGVLTKVSKSGKRTNVDVPFASGVAVDKASNVFVAAFAGSPGTGLSIPGGGPVPGTDGQIWKVRF